MNYKRTASLDEVYLQILANEEHAVRDIEHEDVLERFRYLTTGANLANPEDSLERKRLLFGHRDNLLWRLPPDMSWYVAEVSAGDYDQFHVIDIGGWREFSQETGRVSSAAEIFVNKEKRMELLSRLGDKPYPSGEAKTISGWIQKHVDEIEKNEMRKIRDGELNCRLVLVRDPTNRLTLIDGNHRAVAVYAHYVLNGNESLSPHEVFVGWTCHPCVWTGANPYYEFSLHERNDWRKFMW